MTQNRKLRLVVTDRCHNSCPMCCNNRFDLSKLPVVEHWDYDEIMITGGEPMLFPYDVFSLVRAIRKAAPKSVRRYLYTAMPPMHDTTFSTALCHFDGIVATPHTTTDVEMFRRMARPLLHMPGLCARKSLRLNLFPEVRSLLEGFDISLWKVKDMQWIKDCPVPDGEDLRRINNLFR